MQNSIVYFLLIYVFHFSSNFIMPVLGQTKNTNQIQSVADFVLEDQFKKSRR